MAVAAVAAGCDDREQLVEIEIDNGLQLLARPRGFEIVRKAVEPGTVILLEIDQGRDCRRPPLWPGRRLVRPAQFDAMAGLALGDLAAVWVAAWQLMVFMR